MTGPLPAAPADACPYPGLRPYDQSESDLFFGREAQIDQVLQKLSDRRFLALVGSSGCGKSSLARAGMIAALKAGFLSAARARWRVAVLQPGGRPLTNLAAALLKSADPGADPGGRAGDVAGMIATLRRGPLGLVELLGEHWGPDGSPLLPETANLLLLVDQFEEIFRFRKGDPNEAAAFVALLLRTVGVPDLPVYVVLTMRSDYLGDCALFPGLPETLSGSQFLIPRLTRDQRKDAIEGPARVADGRVAEPLVHRVLNDMGAELDQLPLMQHALMRMWRRAGRDAAAAGPVALGLPDYDRVGTLARALNDHAEETYAALPPARRRVAEVMFRCLCERDVGPGDGRARDVRRPVQVRAVADAAGVPAAEVVAVADQFRAVGRNFLSPGAGRPLAPDDDLDITHESLIRQWQTLQGWVADEAKSADTYRRLVDHARRYKAGVDEPLNAPQLAQYLDWAGHARPTPAWAKRYERAADDFDLFAALVADSQAADRDRKAKGEREERERKEAQEARRWNRRMRVGIGIGLVMLAGTINFSVWAIRERARADAARADAVAAKTDADRQRDQADLGRWDAERQRGIAEANAAAAADNAFWAESAAAAEAEQRRRANAEARAARTHLLGRDAQFAAALSPGKALALAVEAANLETPDPDQTISDEAAFGVRQAMANLGGAPVGLLPRRLARVVATTDDRHRLHWVAAADALGEVWLWDMRVEAVGDRRPVPLGPGGGPAGKGLKVSADGRWLVAESAAGVVTRWDLWAADPAGRSRALAPPPMGEPTVDEAGEWMYFKVPQDVREGDEEADEFRLTDLRPAAPAGDPKPFTLRAEGLGFLNFSFTRKPTWRAVAAAWAVDRRWDGRWLALIREDGTPFLVDLSAVRPGVAPAPVRLNLPADLTKGPPARRIRNGEFADDGRALVVTCLDGTFLTWRRGAGGWDPTPTADLRMPPAAGPLAAVARSPDFASWGRATVYTDRRGVWAVVTARPAAGAGRLAPGNADDLAVGQPGRRPGKPTGRLYNLSGQGPAGPWDLENFDPDLTATTNPTLLVSAPSRWAAVRCNGPYATTLRLWDLAGGPARGTDLETADRVREYTGSPDGRWLIARGTQNTVTVWDLWFRAGRPVPVRLCGHDTEVTAQALTGDGRWLVTGAADGTVRAWDLSRLSRTVEPAVFPNPAGHTGLARRPYRPTRVMTTDADGRVRAWDPGRADPFAEYDDLAAPAGPGRRVYHPSRDGLWAVVPTADGKAADLWALMGPEPRVWRRRLVPAPGPDFVVSRAGAWLAAADPETNRETVRVWDLGANPTRSRPLPKDPARPPADGKAADAGTSSLGFTAADLLLTTDGRDLRFWDPAGLFADPPPAPVSICRNPAEESLDPVLAPDGRRLITFDQAQGGEVWDPADPTAPLGPLLRPDPKFGLLAGLPVPFDVRDTKSAKEVLQEVFQPEVTPDGRWLIARARDDRACHLWDLTAPGHRFVGTTLTAADPAAERDGLVLAPDRNWVFTARGPRARLWDLRTPAGVPPVGTDLALADPRTGEALAFRSALFGPDSDWLVVLAIRPKTGGQVALVWDLSGRAYWGRRWPDPFRAVPVGEFKGTVTRATVSHGRWLALSGADVRIWDLFAHDPTPVVLSPQTPARPAVFVDPLGRRAVLIDPRSNAVQVATLGKTELLDVARRSAVRNLTPQEWKTVFPSDVGYHKTFDFPEADPPPPP